MNAAAFCLRVIGATSRSIGEALALGALKGDCGTAHVIDAKFRAGVLPKIELGKVAV
jgi:hypothetical protein